MTVLEERKYTPAQLTKYRSIIRSAYREGKLSSEQIAELRSAGFNFDVIGNTRPIIDLTTGEVFETMTAAAKAVEAGGTPAICHAIEHKRLVNGHAFWYADDPNPPTLNSFRIPRDNAIKPVVDLTTGETFETLTIAAKSINITSGSTIAKAIKDRRLYKGHAFWWADDPNPPDISEFREPTDPRRPVIDLTTGEVYGSASDVMGKSTIRGHIKDKRLYKGHAFWWADDPNPPALIEFREPIDPRKPVIDLTTGEVFETMDIAKNVVGAKGGGVIHTAIRNKRLYKGHAFWWADDPNPPALIEFREPIDPRKPVIDLTTGEVFETVRDAAQSVGFKSGTSVANTIEDKRLYKGHALWWADDPNPPDISEFRESAHLARPIVNLTTGEVFESMDAAAKSINIVNRASLREAIAKKRLVNGHAFWWADDPNPPSINEFRKPEKPPKRIIDLTTSEVFETMAAAAKSVGARGSCVIADAVKDKRLFKGHAFWYADDPNPPNINEFRKPERGPKPVIDLTTDKVYRSVAAASKSIGFKSNTAITNAIRNKSLLKGHAFWWADDPNRPDRSEFRVTRNTSA